MKQEEAQEIVIRIQDALFNKRHNHAVHCPRSMPTFLLYVGAKEYHAIRMVFGHYKSLGIDTSELRGAEMVRVLAENHLNVVAKD